ncbi:MAG: hypothetical protein OEL89_02215 [Candidatus Peregrinibacteria bacterium]|nr:hypothetical protein [Candidatus Peregrinibacteria bacterium]
MKKILILTVSVLVFGCVKNVENPTTEIGEKPSTTFEQIETVGLGESCVEKKCTAGLECSNKNICIESVVDKSLECPKTQSPVCGLKDGRKNAFLNDCEARRHGAKILYGGFCKAENIISNDCKGIPIPTGLCDQKFGGAYFDGKDCKPIVIQGCSIEMPFADMNLCEEKCLETETVIETETGMTFPVEIGAPIKKAKTGEMCGGIAGIVCEKNSVCMYEKDNPDASGTCIAIEPDKTAELLKVCPQEKIINQMPLVVDDPTVERPVREYFVLDGERKEIAEFDPEFIKDCEITETIVH